MFYRTETHTPKAPCSVVAEEMGDEAMCSFMKSDGDDYWDRPGRHKIYGVAVHDLRTVSSFSKRRHKGAVSEKCRVTSISIPFGAPATAQPLFKQSVHLQQHRPSRYEGALSLAMGSEA